MKAVLVEYADIEETALTYILVTTQSRVSAFHPSLYKLVQLVSAALIDGITISIRTYRRFFPATLPQGNDVELAEPR